MFDRKFYSALKEINQSELIRYAAISPDENGKGDYQVLFNQFQIKKESLELLIRETGYLKDHEDMSYYLLGEDWKKHLEYIPGSYFLKDYEDSFFVYRYYEDESVKLDENLYQSVINWTVKSL